MEPQYNEGSRGWQNLLATTRFRYIEVLFHIFCYYWGKENRLLYRGSLYRGSPVVADRFLLQRTRLTNVSSANSKESEYGS